MANQRRLRFAAILMAVVATLLLGSCSGMRQVRNIRFTSFRIASFQPRGLRSADLALKVGVSNPGNDLIVRDLSGLIKKNGKAIARLVGDQYLIYGPRVDEYVVPCSLSLEKGVSVLDLIGMIGEGDFSAYTIDVTAKLVSGGTTRNLKIKRLRISDLIQ